MYNSFVLATLFAASQVSSQGTPAPDKDASCFEVLEPTYSIDCDEGTTCGKDDETYGMFKDDRATLMEYWEPNMNIRGFKWFENPSETERNYFNL